jgi:hypothetical protein
MITSRPDWKDAEKVAKWAREMRGDTLLRLMGFGEEEELPESELSIIDEDGAVELAKHGKIQDLAYFIRNEAFLQYGIKPATLLLIAEFLLGERNLKTGGTGKDLKRRGRPRMTDDERATRTPTHDAANYFFPAVRQLLEAEYPGLTVKDYRDRAYYIAGLMSDREDHTIEKYRTKKSRRKRQRI